MVRHCFFSFHYQADSHRAAQVRNMGSVAGNKPASDNDWESINRGGETAIKRWIQQQMLGKSCTVVLVGAHTANRPWINYEIKESWRKGMGVVGIRVHGLKDLSHRTSTPGHNPFDFISMDATGTRLSSIAQCYSPQGPTSKEMYQQISWQLAPLVEAALAIRSGH